MIATLCAFKAVTIGLIVVAARPHAQLAPMLVAMNWPWLIVLGLLLSVIPFGFWLRLLRARARRRKLQQAEWSVGPPRTPIRLKLEPPISVTDSARLN
jgi:hypothetical protein